MKNKILIPICIGLFILAACQKETTQSKATTTNTTTIVHPPVITPPTPANTDGFGASNKPLSGKPYSFPAGVTMSGSIWTNLDLCASSQIYECPTDGTLPFYMSLHNSNATPTMVIFPVGMVIPCGDSTLQGAVLVQPDSFTMPAGSTICVNLYAMCVNDKRTFSNNKEYGSPLITANTNLNPLISLLATKKTITYDPDEVIQKAVWHIADTGVMTDSDKIAINAFP